MATGMGNEGAIAELAPGDCDELALEMDQGRGKTASSKKREEKRRT